MAVPVVIVVALALSFRETAGVLDLLADAGRGLFVFQSLDTQIACVDDLLAVLRAKRRFR